MVTEAAYTKLRLYKKIYLYLIIISCINTDQTTVKGIFSEEANQELEEMLNSKAFFFNLGGKGVRTSDKEAMQSLYSLTLCLDADQSKMTNPVF